MIDFFTFAFIFIYPQIIIYLISEKLKDLDLIRYTSELNVIRILHLAFMPLKAFKHRILNFDFDYMYV